jgi:hypothetical protein
LLFLYPVIKTFDGRTIDKLTGRNALVQTPSPLITPFVTQLAPFTEGGSGNASTPNPTLDVTRLRPYTEDSFWNTPVGPSPEYDPYSNEMIATIGLDNDGQITSNTDNYTYTIYFADEKTPRTNIPCMVYKCTLVTPQGSTRVSMLENVPIPPGAHPSGGTDSQMIIIDKTNLTEYNLWGATKTRKGWETRNGSIYNLRWDGTPEEYGSRGAGLPYYGGVIRTWEIEQGHIDHVIGFAYPYPAVEKCVYPASKTDGNSDLKYAIPEGAHLVLDPNLTEADFNKMGISRTGKIIAKALQKYGMVLVNYAGRPKIYAENLTDNPFATQKWTDRGLDLTNDVITNIPYTDFKVLKLPPGYWNPDEEAAMHGDCYAFPDKTVTSGPLSTLFGSP